MAKPSTAAAPATVRATIDLDPKLHRAFRMKLSEQGRTAADVLREAIVAFIGKAK